MPASNPVLRCAVRALCVPAVVLVLAACDAERAAGSSLPEPASSPVAAEVSAARDAPGEEADEGSGDDEAGPAQLAQFGGAAAATAELCGKPYDPVELKAMKEKQKDLYVAVGGDASRYEAEFESGYARGKREFEAAGADRRHQFCGRGDDGP